MHWPGPLTKAYLCRRNRTWTEISDTLRARLVPACWNTKGSIQRAVTDNACQKKYRCHYKGDNGQSSCHDMREIQQAEESRNDDPYHSVGKPHVDYHDVKILRLSALRIVPKTSFSHKDNENTEKIQLQSSVIFVPPCDTFLSNFVGANTRLNYKHQSLRASILW